ncbi:MAG: hypothetical protein WDO14_17910 [Bacteroidota bacterium]
MKNVTPLVLAATLTLSSFSADRTIDNLRPAEVTARGIVSALRQSSEAKFVALFPTLAEFHRQMDNNESFYGLNLDAAKKDFAKTYSMELLPAVRRAYATLVDEAEKRNIDWSDVTVVSVELPEATTGFSTMKITFGQDGKKFDLLIERSLMIDGKWKVSQYVKFI